MENYQIDRLYLNENLYLIKNKNLLGIIKINKTNNTETIILNCQYNKIEWFKCEEFIIFCINTGEERDLQY